MKLVENLNAIYGGLSVNIIPTVFESCKTCDSFTDMLREMVIVFIQVGPSSNTKYSINTHYSTMLAKLKIQILCKILDGKWCKILSKGSGSFLLILMRWLEKHWIIIQMVRRFPRTSKRNVLAFTRNSEEDRHFWGMPSNYAAFCLIFSFLWAAFCRLVISHGDWPPF